MTDFKLVSWIVGGRKGARNKQQTHGPQLGIFDHGQQKKAEENQRQVDLKPGWFYWKFGRLVGPFSDAEIFDLFDQGELQEDSLVTLLNMPLAMLLKDPAKRLDAHPMVHLKKPGLERYRAAMPSTPAHSNVPNGKPTAWPLPISTDAKQLAEDCVADHAESTGDHETACGKGLEVGQVGNGNFPNGKPATWLFPNSADAKTFASVWVAAKSEERDDTVCGEIVEMDRVGNGNCFKKISTLKTESRDADAPTYGREASEVGDMAKVEASKTDKFKWRKTKAGVRPSKAATLPIKTAARGADQSEPQPAKHKSKRKGPAKHLRDVSQKK